ncbi:MAG: DEAD/DEAH box helicase [Opitutus sp.]|nr:DEAD/DEAH box helicase [Opitutus sp.]MCS6245845.1 DEAD/DEAH box helicase [Opitutus sp.]MCS6246809.1 DEAD/DEAH box helicase [Opitutus sp.]MCS6272891.1 DEAD/DEAH box helicase [Opitutus sp.]MCS6278428.1 DEAD/DEAH box helicase [Opitutus sp.]
MSRFNLRPYQTACVEAVLSKFRQHGKLLAVLPTAAGKTVIFSHTAEKFAPGRTLILAHREELLSQAADKLTRATGIVAETECGTRQASLNAQVVVASVQTLMGEKRLSRWPRDHFNLVVVDEAHHALAESYQRVLRHFDGHAKVLGVTATPDRGDKKNLGTYFEDIAFEVGLHELIEQGYLTRISVLTLPVEINLTEVRTLAGDYNDADLGIAIEPLLRGIVTALRESIGTRKTLVFLPLIRTSQLFVELCQEAGFTAAHIDGQGEDRAELLARFAAGDFQILSNSMLLTEGFDEPSIECVICLRPTKVRALYAQIIGRGTRLHPGKENLLVLDFLWMTGRHSIVRPAHLVASTPEIADAMIAQSVEAAVGKELDLLKAEIDAKSQREASLATELAANAKRAARQIDPVEFALSLHELDLAEYAPTMAWHHQPPSFKQLSLLERNGLDPAAIRDKGHAAAIIDRILARRNLGLATPKQVACLRRNGHPRPDLVTFADAGVWMTDRFKNQPTRRAA